VCLQLTTTQQPEAFVRHSMSLCSRSYIRHACGDDTLPVPSPTYLLLNSYEDDVLEDPPVHHIDLYRLGQQPNTGRLGLPLLFDSGACLIEWPSRLQERPARAVDVKISVLTRVRSVLCPTYVPNQAPVGVDERRLDCCCVDADLRRRFSFRSKRSLCGTWHKNGVLTTWRNLLTPQPTMRAGESLVCTAMK
jgi:hypothetical protein